MRSQPHFGFFVGHCVLPICLEGGVEYAHKPIFLFISNTRGTMIKHQGGCHCGQIRFTTEYDPIMVAQCNCSRCRRLFGAVGVSTIFGSNEVEITGTPKKYTFNGGSSMPVHLYFCSECGTRLYAVPEVMEGFMGVILGAFDDSVQFEPRAEIFTNYKMKWLRDNGCIKESFEEAAVMERLQALMENLDQRG